MSKSTSTSEYAITVENVSKTFVIPHEKITTLKGAFVNFWKKKTYEEFYALKDVSFAIRKGECFGIIGRNGSGKSTLLKILAGVYAADTGTVSVNGRISPFLELGIGFNPELSGRDNVYLNATVLGMSKKQIDAQFDSIIAFAELERFVDQKLKNYSSGMQVRLAFAVSIHANRDILLMDEVLAVGDANFQAKCLTEFQRLRSLGKTIILVTHDISVVERYCDSALLLRDGELVTIGKALDVANAYIQQNITDEGKTIVEKIEEEQPEQIRIAKITKITFLDKDRKPSTLFASGDTLVVKVEFDVHQKIDVIHFGIGLFNSVGDYLFGVNTFMDNVDTREALKRGFFEIEYQNVPFNNDTYYVNSGLYADSEMKPYDYVHKSNSFQATAPHQYRGGFSLEHSWK